jgi:cytoskeletal protein CcmA (bactofilin family)
MNVNHIDEMSCLLYIEGQLERERALEVSSHAAECASCRELLRAMQLEGMWLREALAVEEEPVPARLLVAPERNAPAWGWIVSLGLAAGGAYTVWSGIIEPWQAQAARAGFTQGNLLTMLFFSGAFWKGWDAMRSLMEFLAMATLGITVMWLLKKRLRRFTAIAFVMGVLGLTLALPSPATAGETKYGDPNYTLAAGEETPTDLIVFADTTRIEGTVDGDLLVWSRSVTVSGHIKGDIIAFCQNLHVKGQVDGNVRTFTQSFDLNANVGRNVMAWSQDSDLDTDSKVGGTAMVGGANVELNGQVSGDAMLFGDLVEIGGTLGRNVRAGGGTLRISSGAEIKGATEFKGHNQPEISSSAKLASPPKVTIETRSHTADYQSWRYYWHQTLFGGARFLFGLVIILLAPGFFADVQSSVKKAMPAFGFGLLFAVAIPILAILVCFTIVGIGVSVASVLLYIVAMYSARVFVAAWLGELLLGPSTGVGGTVARMALGLLIVQVVTMLPYFVGFFCALIIAAWGLGAITLTFYKYMRPHAPAMA